MNGRKFHIPVVFLLILFTSSSVWGQFLVEKPGIEISEQFEKDAEKGEKNAKKEIESDDDISSETGKNTPSIFCGLQKAGSNSFAPSEASSIKLYILYGRLRLDC